MCSNHTSILHIDLALIPLLGFDANKKILSMQRLNAQDLSISNILTIRALVTYLTEHGDYAPEQALMMKPT
jgi:hypothetical protein